MKVANLVSVNNAIMIVMEEVEGLNNAYIPRMTRWAIDADKEIGARNTYAPKRKAIKAVGPYLEIPCDAIFIKPVIVAGDHENDSCCDECINAVSGSDEPVVMVASEYGLTYMSVGGVRMEYYKRGSGYKIYNRQIRFNCDQNGKVFTISYVGYQTDCDGFPMVRESNLNAIAAYIKYKLADMMKWTDKKFTAGEMDRMHREYGRQVGKALVAANSTTAEEDQELINMINSPFYRPQISDFIYAKDYNCCR